MKSTDLCTRRWENAKAYFHAEANAVESWTGRPLTERMRKEIWQWAYKKARLSLAERALYESAR